MKTYSVDQVAKALRLNHWVVRYWFDHLNRRVGRPRNRQAYERRILTSRDFEKAKKALTQKGSATALVCGGNDFTSITVEMKKAFGEALQVKAVSLNALEEVAQNCRPCCIIIDAAETTRAGVLKVVRRIQNQSWGSQIEIHSLFPTEDKFLRVATHETRKTLIGDLKRRFEVKV